MCPKMQAGVPSVAANESVQENRIARQERRERAKADDRPPRKEDKADRHAPTVHRPYPETKQTCIANRRTTHPDARQ